MYILYKSCTYFQSTRFCEIKAPDRVLWANEIGYVNFVSLENIFLSSSFRFELWNLIIYTKLYSVAVNDDQEKQNFSPWKSRKYWLFLQVSLKWNLWTGSKNGGWLVNKCKVNGIINWKRECSMRSLVWSLTTTSKFLFGMDTTKELL